MSSDVQVTTSLVGAIQNNHIPLSAATEDILGRVLFSVANHDAASRLSQRQILQSMIEAVDDAIKQIDNKVYTVVNETLGEDFDPIIDVAKNLAAEIDRVAAIHGQVEQENAFASNGLSTFSDLYHQYETARTRDREVEATVAILTDLQHWSQLVQKVEDALERGEIASAQKHLMDTNTLVSNLQTSTQALRVLSEINLRTADLTESLKMALVHEWDNMISLQLNGDKATLKLSGNDEHLISLLSDLTRYDLLSGQVNTLAQSIEQHIVKPLLRGHTVLESKDDTLMTTSFGQSHPQNPESIISDITTLVGFLSGNMPPTLLDSLTSALLPAMVGDILAFLSLRNASSIDDLPEFNTLVSVVAHLESQIVNSGWSTETALSKWANGTSIWFSNRQSTVLAETRNMIIRESSKLKPVLISRGVDICAKLTTLGPSAVGKEDAPAMEVEHQKQALGEGNDEDEDEPDAWGFDVADEEVEEPADVNGGPVAESWEWNEDNEDLNTSVADNPDSFPYTVSSIPDSLQEIIDRILNERTLLQSPRYAEYSQLTNATQYSSMVISILTTWRAIVQLRRTEMSAAERMMLSNDALYLARRLVVHSNDPTIAIEVDHLSHRGEAWFHQELTQEKGSLSRILSSTNRFVNSAHPEQARKCTQAIDSLKKELTSLSSQYRNILPPQKLRTALGELLSFALEYINTSLDLMEDISTDESTFLIGLYTSVFGLDKLFSPYEASQFCPAWLKSQYIRELLEWRMVDIMESWREGLLQGVFEKNEMARWLKKLFQDSDVRARNIAEIQRG